MAFSQARDQLCKVLLHPSGTPARLYPALRTLYGTADTFLRRILTLIPSGITSVDMDEARAGFLGSEPRKNRFELTGADLFFGAPRTFPGVPAGGQPLVTLGDWFRPSEFLCLWAAALRTVCLHGLGRAFSPEGLCDFGTLFGKIKVEENRDTRNGFETQIKALSSVTRTDYDGADVFANTEVIAQVPRSLPVLQGVDHCAEASKAVAGLLCKRLGIRSAKELHPEVSPKTGTWPPRLFAHPHALEDSDLLLPSLPIVFDPSPMSKGPFSAQGYQSLHIRHVLALLPISPSASLSRQAATALQVMGLVSAFVNDRTAVCVPDPQACAEEMAQLQFLGAPVPHDSLLATHPALRRLAAVPATLSPALLLWTVLQVGNESMSSQAVVSPPLPSPSDSLPCVTRVTSSPLT